MRNRGSLLWRIAAMALLPALFPMLAQATLYGVAYDKTLLHEKLVRVSTIDASITDTAAVALAGCCRVNGSLVASDDGNQTAYLVTPDPDPVQPWRLHRISLSTGTAVTVTLPPTERVAAIVRRSVTSTLFALSDAGAGLRLTRISDAGAVSDVGTPILADCCAVRVGVAAISANGSAIAFVARLQPAASDPPLRLFVISSSTGALISNSVLAHSPDVLFSTSGSTFSAIYHDAGTERVGVIAGDGSITPVGPGLAGCCALYAGVGARSGNLLRVVARLTADTAIKLYEVNIGTGTFTEIGALPNGYVINGLIESNVQLVSDLIFRDGFDPAATVVSGKRDESGTSTDSQAAALAAQEAEQTAQAAAQAQAAAASNKIGEDPLGTVPAGVTALPVGSHFAWLTLIILLAALAIRRRRRLF